MISKWLAKQAAKPEGIGGKLSTLAMNIGNQGLYRSVLSHLPEKKDCTILDVGYGNGYVLKRMLRRGYTSIYGLEISESMQRVMQNKLKQKERSYCHLTLGSIEQMPYEHASFDVIYSINTLYFWQSLEAGLTKLYEACKTDGIVMLAIYDKRFLQKLPSTKYGFHLYETKEIEQQMLRYGFHIKEVIKKGYGAGLCYVLTKQ